MESITNLLKLAKQFVCRIKLLPSRFWFNKNIGNYTSIDKRYISIIGDEFIKIGDGCKIMAGLRMEAITRYRNQDYTPSITIGDSVFINQNVHCTCASKIEIGNGTSITSNCGIFDIIHPYEDININPRHQQIKTKPIRIGSNCMIGMNSVILPGVTLGDHIVVGANSTVIEGVYPAYSVLAGMPAKIIKRFDTDKKEWRRTNNNGNFID